MHAKLLLSLLLLATSLVPAFSQTQIITYANVAYGSDPAQIMDIYVPTDNKVHPAIVLLHGGAWVSGDKQALSPIADYFAKQGYTVANINYRLATLTSNQYPTAIEDAHVAVLFLQRKATAYKMDGNRIAAFGTSAGANLALSLGTQGWVDAVVDFYGPADFTDPNFLAENFQGQSCSQFLEKYYFGVSFTQNPSFYANASPLDNISTRMPPTIIFHGSLDQLVPVAQSENLQEQLHDVGIVSKLNIETGLGHGFLTDPSYNPQPVLQQCVTFLNTYMP
jgi:acetyl esterase/lipase